MWRRFPIYLLTAHALHDAGAGTRGALSAAYTHAVRQLGIDAVVVQKTGAAWRMQLSLTGCRRHRHLGICVAALPFTVALLTIAMHGCCTPAAHGVTFFLAHLRSICHCRLLCAFNFLSGSFLACPLRTCIRSPLERACAVAALLCDVARRAWRRRRSANGCVRCHLWRSRRQRIGGRAKAGVRGVSSASVSGQATALDRCTL